MTELGVIQTTAQLRVLSNEYLRWFTAEIKRAADSAAAREHDLAIQEAAIRFKISAVTSMQAATFQRDPIAGLADAWALTEGMALFFEEGEGKDLFGGSQSIVVEALHGLESEIEALVEQVVGKERADETRLRIERFVRDNPYHDLSFGRRSAGLKPSTVTAATLGGGGLSSVGDIEETARDLSDRVTIYAEQQPDIARWQGELLLIAVRRQILAEPLDSVQGIESKLGDVVGDVHSAADFLTGTPDLVASERALLVETLQKERALILSSINEQRTLTLDALTAERKAILAAGEELRQASFVDLAQESERSLDRIHGLSKSLVMEFSQASREAIDHLFFRALQLLLIAFAAAAILAFALRLTDRSRRIEPSA